MAVNAHGKPYCEADVHDSFGVSFHKCNRTAKYALNGITYCGLHYPPNIAARQKASPKCGIEDCSVRVHHEGLRCAFHRRLATYYRLKIVKKENGALKRRIKQLEKQIAETK